MKYTSKQLEQRINAVELDVVAWFTSDPKSKRKETAACRRVRNAYSVANGGGMVPYWWTQQTSSTKLMHNGHIVEVEEAVHYGAPARESGLVNMCIHSTPQCRKLCLWRSGQLGMPDQQRATVIRTRFMVEHPYEWAVCWLAELESHARRIHAKGKEFWARPNGTTDHRYEEHGWLLDLAYRSGVDLFFDYTKRKDRDHSLGRYYLARSATEHHTLAEIVPGMVVPVDAGKDDPLPTMWNGMPVIDGDHEFGDLRPLDRTRPDAVVLLRAKGLARAQDGNVGSFVWPVDVKGGPVSPAVRVKVTLGRS